MRTTWPDRDVLLEGGLQLVDARRPRSSTAASPLAATSVGQLVGQVDELGRLGHEVGLGAQLDDGAPRRRHRRRPPHPRSPRGRRAWPRWPGPARAATCAALSMSPSFSSRARLASSMPTPVAWRSVWTSLAEKSAMLRLSSVAGRSARASALGGRLGRRRPRCCGAGGRRRRRARRARRSLRRRPRSAAAAGRRRGRARRRRPSAAASAWPAARRVGAAAAGAGAGAARTVWPLAPAAGGAGPLLGDEPTLDDGVGHHPAQQGARADGVVVARDHVGDHVGVAVGVDHRHDRHAELVGLGDGDVLLLGVDHEDGVGQPVEAADAAEVALELLELTACGAAPPSSAWRRSRRPAAWPRTPASA